MKIAKVAVPAPIVPFDVLFDYLIPEELEESVFQGSLVEIPLGKRKTFGVVFSIQNSTDYDFKKLKSIISPKIKHSLFTTHQLEFFKYLSRYYFYPLGEVCGSAIPSAIRDASPKMIQKSMESAEKLGASKNIAAQASQKLNSDQQNAYDKFCADPQSPHLLFGVTGSGKTEVYLEIIEHCLSQGKSAIVLVPEIALTPQLKDRFEKRFPDDVAIFHSAQKPKDLRKAWFETLLRKKRIALGARSAIFAPIQNLGVIIVDEEHDSSYKQEDRLKYSARDAALKLAQLSGAGIVLGSATPSCEALFEVAEKKIDVTQLPNRAVGEAKLPQIEVYDLKKNIPQKSPQTKVTPANNEKDFENSVGGDFFLSPPLKAGLQESLNKGQQAILFLNRRGVGSQKICRTCGTTMDCPNCDVTLTPHRHHLLCHYCGYQATAPKMCEACKSDEYPYIEIGIGTEAIESSVKLHFPEARTSRLDRDTVTNHEDLIRIIEDFRSGKNNVLIGTQMVAKGHDFPQVTFVGIILAELGLAVPDFRAYEKNLQLLLQVSGRAGRGLHPGKVVLQSFQPDHPVFAQLSSQKSLEDYSSFISAEIEKRRLLLYPPHAFLSLLRFDGADSKLVEEAAVLVGHSLNKLNSKTMKILGPVQSPIFKIRNRFRFQILVKATQEESLSKAIEWIFSGWQKNKFERKFKTRMIIDRDPHQML